jgi:glycosyltransferase involved in cell wall biosynthesis
MTAPAKVVSLTPIAAMRDSRTIRIAASFARMGLISIVVENFRSADTPAHWPFATIALGRAVGDGGTARGAARRVLAQAVRERLYFLGFVALYLGLRPLIGGLRVPRARLYYLHEYRLFPLVWLLTRLHRVPFVYDAHDFYPLVHDPARLSGFWRRRFLPLIVWLERSCVRRAAAVVTVNESIAGLYAEAYGVRPLVIRNCHDRTGDQPGGPTIRARLGLESDDFLLVAIGHAKDALATDRLIEALRDAPPAVHVALIGRGHEATMALAQRLGLGARVHAPGAIAAHALVPALEGADASIILYRPVTADYAFSLPNKLFQAIAAGLPVLYPALVEIKGLAEAHGFGLEIDPARSDSIAVALNRLVDDAPLRATLGANARRAAEALSWENEENRLAELVRSLLPGEGKIECGS